MDPTTKFRAALNDDIWPFLREHGFNRRGHIFRRRTATAWQIVDVAQSKWSSAARVEFAIELGAKLDVLASADDEGWRKRGWPMEWQCDLRHRLLDRNTTYYTVGRFTPLRRLARRLVDDLENGALPWLDLHADPARLLSSIEADLRVVLDLSDVTPLGDLARATGTATQLAAVHRTVAMTVEHLRGLEARAS